MIPMSIISKFILGLSGKGNNASGQAIDLALEECLRVWEVGSSVLKTPVEGLKPSPEAGS